MSTMTASLTDERANQTAIRQTGKSARKPRPVGEEDSPGIRVATVGDSQLEGFDSDLTLTRKLTAKFGSMTSTAGFGQEEARPR